MKGIGAEWLEKQGFNENGYTYVYYGQDSYEIKSMLKDAGFRFSRELMWHCPNKDNFYADKCFEVHYTTVLQLMAYGKGFYFEDAAQKIKAKIDSYLPPSNSAFVEPDEDGKIRTHAKCTSIRQIDGVYGLTNLFTFENDMGDKIIWYSSSCPNIEVGDEGELVGTFKKHDTFRNVAQTVITRAKLK